MHDERAPFRNARWVECYNAGSSTIANFSIVEIVESVDIDGLQERTTLSVRTPTVDAPRLIAITGPTHIYPGKTGVCTLDFPAWVRYTGVQPYNGSNLNAASGSDAGSINYYGLRVIGGAGTTAIPGAVRVDRRHGPDLYIMKTPATGIGGRVGVTVGYATCAQYKILSNTLTATGVSRAVYNLSAYPIAANTYIYASEETISGQLVAIWEDC